MQKTLFAQVDLFCGSGELIACTCHLINNNNKYINLATTNNSNNLTTTTNNKNYLTNSNRSGGVSSPGSSLAGALSSPKLSQQKIAGLCSCSSVQRAPGQLVVTKAKCCRSGPGDPGEVIVDATTPMGAKSRLVLCPAHLPREYRCYCML